MSTYFENFDDGPGGWHRWVSNAAGPAPVEIRQGAANCRGPWWVDYNHAPPGAGYLSLLMCLRTRGAGESTGAGKAQHAEEVAATGGINRLVEQGHGIDFRGATVAVRLRGEVDLRGAQLLYHVQSFVRDRWVNYVLTGRPFTVTPDWSEQEVTLDADASVWTSLGSRHDRADFYGTASIDDVLRDVNGNMIFVLYPLNIVPSGTVAPGQLHTLRAGEDYELDRSKLPSGWVMFDWVRITFRR
jgi:hypothetical protein